MRQNVIPPVSGPDFRFAEADDASLAQDLELVAKRLADVTRKASRERDLETALVTASAEQERRAREAAHLASEAHERTAGMLTDALGLMTRRLDEIERKITEAQPPALDAALTAVERIEAQMTKLGQEGRGQAYNA